ncbi:A24 family peptidase [Calycomorphotria hydatis]|uniref:Type 4 prepilin-like proteins leader peptide-processing enzyme n=1 Tax=Calycomorphotria hydatis TaxID=2528027 RepID=A0A517T7X4_9PLAN|nr:A24 family peptidase [Calycomorphotria hydatis]QDT64473.1 Type 4 prepilin-like proteins leader peptide-processing enzyme [Calycomorphotria hydatis]
MDWATFLLENWHVKVVALILIWAAWIDGKELRVPNWMTYPMALTGLIFNCWVGGWAGLGDGMLGLVAGLLTLMPLYAVGGMGAGDVKLMAGMGAWLGWEITVYAFAVSVVVGAVMAVAMVLWRGAFQKHYANFLMLWFEWATVKDPRKLSAIARERKPTMMLLPYGIPICVGSIAYFFYAGLI